MTIEQIWFIIFSLLLVLTLISIRWQYILFWFKTTLDVPIIGEYYIGNLNNSWNSAIYTIIDRYEDNIEIYCAGGSHNIGRKKIVTIDNFFNFYRWISEKDVQRFLPNKIVSKLKPLFVISDYNVYHINEKWIIILTDDKDQDVENSETYLSLSMALIDHNL